MKFLIYLFNTSLILNTIFPSRFLFSLKAAVFLGLIIQTFKFYNLNKNYFISFSATIFSLIVSLIVGLVNNNEYSIDAFSAYSIFFILLFVHLIAFESILSQNNPLEAIKKTARILTYGALGYILFKFLIYFLIVSEIFSVFEIKQLVPGMIINTFYGNPILTRIFSTSDLVVVFLIVLNTWLSLNKIKDNRSIISTFLITSSVLSLNRYVWLILGFNFLLMTKLSTKLKIWLGLLIVVPLSSIFLGNNFDLFIEYLNIKFSDNLSLDVKETQAKYIINDIIKKPVFGNGIGWYNKSMIRDYNQPFQYETQILSLISQLGIINFLVIISSVFLTLISFNIRLKTKRNIINLFFIILWFASGFTNPYLTVIGSIPVYLVLKCLNTSKT